MTYQQTGRIDFFRDIVLIEFVNETKEIGKDIWKLLQTEVKIPV